MSNAEYEMRPRCPGCGERMKKRQNSFTGQWFWGCSQYPDCRETREVKDQSRRIASEIDAFGLGVLKASVGALLQQEGLTILTSSNGVLAVHPPEDGAGTVRRVRFCFQPDPTVRLEADVVRQAIIPLEVEFAGETADEVSPNEGAITKTNEDFKTLLESVAFDDWLCTNAASASTDAQKVASEAGVELILRDGLTQRLYDENVAATDLASSPELVEMLVTTDRGGAKGTSVTVVTDQVLQEIREGESSTIEFKASFRWDHRQHRRSKEPSEWVVREIAAFVNSDGGVLLVGVDDNGEIIGLATDGFKTDDEIQRFVSDKVAGRLGAAVAASLRIRLASFPQGRVCRIVCPRGTDPAFLDGDLIVRSGSTTRRLSTQEALQYQRSRWPAGASDKLE